MRGTKQKAISFLKEHPLGVLSTIAANGRSELSAVYCVVGDDLSLYFVTKTKTRKLANIITCPSVSFLVTHEASLTTLEVTGEAYLVEDTIEFAQAFDAFHALFASRPGKKWLPPIVQIKAGKYVACRILPERICIRTFRKHTRDDKPIEIVLHPRRRIR